MNQKTLWWITHPGLSNEIVHFTKRIANEPNLNVAADIRVMDGHARLTSILSQRRLRAHHPYWSQGNPCICFTEATRDGLREFVRRGLYEPWGLGFTKDHWFRRGAGPAFYVRGTDWAALEESNLPPEIKTFATPFWPGADPDPGEGPLEHHLARPTQWAHEREWRLSATDQEPLVPFELQALRLLVVPTEASISTLVEAVPSLAAELPHIEVVVEASPGGTLEEVVAAEAAPDFDPWDPNDPNNPYSDYIEDILRR